MLKIRYFGIGVLFIGALLSVICFTGCGGEVKKDLTVKEMVEYWRSVYPEMNSQDVYKFMHQSAFGPGHAGASVDIEQHYLKEEFGSVKRDTTERLTFPISTDGKVVHVNLRAFKGHWGKWHDLHLAIQESKKEFRQGAVRFKFLWSEYVRSVMTDEIDMDKSELLLFSEEIVENGYPAVHHSEAFGEAYDPSYRVISLDIFKRRFPRIAKSVKGFEESER